MHIIFNNIPPTKKPVFFSENGLFARVPAAGIEPALSEEHDFESCASTSSATPASFKDTNSPLPCAMRLAQKLVGLPLFIFLLVSGSLSAQSRLYTSYTKADGLPSDYVMRITQSPRGFMWFGTERGAAMYDGQSFTTFTTDDGLPHNLVYDILEDAQGRTWFATPEPVLAYAKDGKIVVFRDSTGSQTPLNSLAIDRNHRVFFRFHDGIGVLNGDRYQFHPIPLLVSKESRMERLLDGRLLLSDGSHLMATRLDSGTDLRLDTLLTMDRFFNFVSFAQAPDSSVYVTSFKGVSKYRLTGDRLDWVDHIHAGFNTTISAISSQRIVLGGRYTGLTLIENGQVSPLITSSGSQRNFVSSQFIDYEGNLWVGFFGQGVEKLSSWTTVVHDDESGLLEKNVWRVATHRGDVLAMGVAGIQRIRGNQVMSLPRLPPTLRAIRGIQYDGDRVYIANISSLRVNDYDPQRDVIGKERRNYDMGDGVNDIRLASDGSLWVATAGRRLRRVMRDGTVQEYPMKNGAEKLVRAGDAMWILTSTEGAFRYENGSFKHLTKASGDVPSNTILSLYEDDHATLIGTPLGLTVIPKTGEPTQHSTLPVIAVFPSADHSADDPRYWVVTPYQLYRYASGSLVRGNSLAPLSAVMSGAHWIEMSDDRTKLYIGSNSGLVTYDLTQTGRNIPPPKVAIRGVSLNGTRFPGSSDNPIRQRASSSTLEFEFSGLTFVKESDTEFSYRLIDVDEDWSPAQRLRTVRYANIPPGTYTFEVRAINIEGVASSSIASIQVVIDPPWWMHPLMMIVLVMGAIGALVAGIRWRVKTIRAEIVKRNEQKQFEAIQRIGASISHDIKNTVFSLSLLSKNLEKRFDNPEFRKDAIETIESSLSYLSTLVNRLQEAPNAADAPVREIELRALCTEIVKRVAGGSGRVVDLDIAESIRIRLNPEPIERILENLVRNALEATTTDQTVTLSASRQGNEVQIQVIDNGPGMSEDFIRTRLFKPFQSTKTKGLGIGLYSCKELADAMGATIEVESELGKGTTFRLRFVNSPS